MPDIFFMVHDEARRRAIQAVQEAPEGWRVEVSEPKRSTEQNAAMWPILEAFSEQLDWPVNGQMVKMTAEEWKDVLTAAFYQQQPRVAMGLDGGVVMLGQRTSKFKKKEFSDWLDFLNATAIERGVDLLRETA